MPDLNQLVGWHGSVRKLRVKVAVEHADGFIHEISLPAVIRKGGMTADDIHGEMIKAANALVLANIATDEREKSARSYR